MTGRRLLAGLIAGLVTLTPEARAMGRGLPRAVDPIPLRPGDRLLCLFDSTEGSTATSNPLSGEFARAAARLALDMTFHDVAAGLPAPEAVASARAVVTGFLDGAMDRAAAWPAFVRSVVAAGTRFVIVGNYGAWQERATGEYLASEVVNGAFEALGVRYEADWTDDPERIAIEVRDASLGPPGALSAERVRHYYQFTPIRSDVRVLVAARRTDRSGMPDSAVVFTGATGAMALSKYLSPKDSLDDPSALALDMDAFARAALARRPLAPGTLLVIHDPASPDSGRVLETLAAASAYSGVPVSAVAAADARALRPVDLASHGGVALAASELAAPVDAYVAGLVRDHLGRGGRAVALLPVRNAALAAVFAGVAEQPAPAPARATGIRFRDGAFPGLAGLEARGGGDVLSFSGLRPQLGPTCRVLAESADPPGMPLWWRCQVGRGAVVSLNAFELAERATIGVLLQAVLDATGFWAMPVLASAVEFVDDCPLPMTGGIPVPLAKPDTDFYSDDVYGMVLEAVRRHGIRPAFVGVFSYDDRVTPPFEEPLGGGTGAAARALAARIVADDLAVGLHGANHMSPGLSGGVTRPFPDREALAAWFRAGRAGFRAIFGPLERPAVYVPPNDWIDLAGKQALVAEVPEVRVLSSVFSGTAVEHLQDFGPDPDVPGLVALPRTWAGYVLSGEAALGMVNGVLLYGISSHFIHPDDVLDPERSGNLGWAELRAGYLAGIAEVRRRFPFLRDRGVLETADEAMRVHGLRWRVETLAGGGMRVLRTAGVDGGVVFFARTPDGCTPAVVGGSVVVASPESGLHVVRMDGRSMEVRCRRDGGGS